MNSLFSSYKKAVFWNIQSAFLYKLLLITHQTFLFSITPSIIFGQSGALFAFLFFFIAATNFGFDYSLIALFSKQHKKDAGLSIFTYITYKLCITILCGAGLWFGYSIMHIPYLVFLFQNMSTSLVFGYIWLYITENTKKTLALHADLSFQNKQHFFIEIGSLLGYITTVWSLYFYSGNITLPYLIIPFTVWSSIECIILTIYVYQATRQHKTTDKQNILDIIHHQPINYVNQLLKTAYSPNSIFMLAAWYYGFEKIGIIKLLIDTISFLHTFLYRTIGTPLAALYAREQNIPELQSTLRLYLTFLFVVWACIILGITSWNYLFITQLPLATIMYIISISFLEYAQIPYEKIILVHQKSMYLLFSYVTGISIGVLLHIFFAFPFLPIICLSKFIIFSVVYYYTASLL